MANHADLTQFTNVSIGSFVLKENGYQQLEYGFGVGCDLATHFTKK